MQDERHGWRRTGVHFLFQDHLTHHTRRICHNTLNGHFLKIELSYIHMLKTLLFFLPCWCWLILYRKTENAGVFQFFVEG